MTGATANNKRDGIRQPSITRRPIDRRRKPTDSRLAEIKDEPRQNLARIIRSTSAVIAPLTAITAMLLYVGWVRTRAFYTYFGVNVSILNLSPQDYILRSADVGLGAILLLALVVGVLLLADRAASYMLRRIRSERFEQSVRLTLACLGGTLILIGLNNVTAAAAVAAVPPASTAALVAIGAALVLRFGLQLTRGVALFGSPTAAFGLAVLALASFWAANSYAQRIGLSAAVTIDRDPTELAVVSILSSEPIDIPGKNLAASRIPTTDNKWSYRYVGARLLTYANDRWLLITDPPRSGYHSTVIALRDTDSIRVEISAPGVGST